MDFKTGILAMLVGIAIVGMMVSSVSAGQSTKHTTYNGAEQWLTSYVDFSKPDFSFRVTYYGEADFTSSTLLYGLYSLDGVYTIYSPTVSGVSCGKDCSVSGGIGTTTYSYSAAELPAYNTFGDEVTFEGDADQYMPGYVENTATVKFKVKSYSTSRVCSTKVGLWQLFR